MTIRNVIVACDYAYIEGGAARVAVQTAVELSKRSNLKVYFFAGCGEPCQELVQSSVQVISLGMYDLLGNPSKLDAMKKGIYNRKAGKLLEDLLNTLKKMKQLSMCIHGQKCYPVQSLLLRIKKIYQYF